MSGRRSCATASQSASGGPSSSGVALPPHFVHYTTRRVPHGHGTTVSGWLGTATGTALGGQHIEVLTAPDNGQGAFRSVTSVTTAANGIWTARLGPGPSRLVEASYAGGSLTEPTRSAQVHVIVPAKVKLISVSPPRVGWSGTVRIVGQLLGGYLPPGGALVRLRIGSGSSSTTYGVEEHVTGNGRFSTTYTFGAGQASSHQSFWFQLSSLPMGSYRLRRVTPGAARCSSAATRRFPTAGTEATGMMSSALVGGLPVAMMNRRGIVRRHSHWRPGSPHPCHRLGRGPTLAARRPLHVRARTTRRRLAGRRDRAGRPAADRRGLQWLEALRSRPTPGEARLLRITGERKVETVDVVERR